MHKRAIRLNLSVLDMKRQAGQRWRARPYSEMAENQQLSPIVSAGTRAAMSRSVRLIPVIFIALWATLISAKPAQSSPAEFPFEHRGGLIWVRVSVPQSAELLNFLLDSGAGVSVVNLRTAKRLGMELGRRVDARGVGSSAEGFWPQRLQATAGGVGLPRECLAVDLAELSRACDCGVDGLLGNGLLTRFERVTFDARNGRLVLEGCRAGF